MATAGYVVLHGDDLDGLKGRVRDLVVEGWIPVGGVAVVAKKTEKVCEFDFDREEFVYFQALYRPATSEREDREAEWMKRCRQVDAAPIIESVLVAADSSDDLAWRVQHYLDHGWREIGKEERSSLGLVRVLERCDVSIVQPPVWWPAQDVRFAEILTVEAKSKDDLSARIRQHVSNGWATINEAEFDKWRSRRWSQAVGSPGAMARRKPSVPAPTAGGVR